MSLTKLSPLVGNNLIVPARESLVSDIPPGDGKQAYLFFTGNFRAEPPFHTPVLAWHLKSHQRDSHTHADHADPPYCHHTDFVLSVSQFHLHFLLFEAKRETLTFSPVSNVT
jgi:hypothetical protein